jgi:catechol 2,3-dioxygenase-like lactoylglutathione lyase family enzyme
MTLPEPIAGRPIVQVALVVRDLDAALTRYASVLGPSAWRCFTFGSAMHATVEYRGVPADFTVRLALNDSQPQVELVQPLEGRSVHHDWLEQRGEGLHHVGIVVDSVAEAVEAMAAAGHPVIQAGTGFGEDGDGAYAYFDVLPDLGLTVEVFEPPARLRGPAVAWPGDSS